MGGSGTGLASSEFHDPDRTGAPPLDEASRRASAARAALRAAGRIVVKVGSSSLTEADGPLAVDKLHQLVDVLASRRLQGTQIVLVSSGAQASGMAPLGLTKRPRDLATAQAAASVGQGLLMAHYTQSFGRRKIRVGQILLTPQDLIRRGHYKNAHRALSKLLALGVLPIINENDTVATDEIRFGDNDRLAALVAHLVHADALVLLTDVDGLYDAPPSRPDAHRIPVISGPNDLRGLAITGRGSRLGTGGMVTKVQAATMAASSGIPALLTNAELASQALAGEEIGTLFQAYGKRVSRGRLWLAFAAQTAGRIEVDAGAARAVIDGGRSLLAAGVTGVQGDFDPGDPVEVTDPTGQVIARGLAGYSAHELPAVMGHTTDHLTKVFGPAYDREVIHRDDLVLLVKSQRV